MNTDRFVESKQDLMKELGNKYPKSRKELSVGFLLNFANYIPGPNEDDYKDYREYEKAKYASEQWAVIDNLAKAIVALEHDGKAGKAAWDNYLDWIVDNYFPEFV